MKQILYAKYNRSRCPEYQISTIICEQNGVKYVEKAAISEEAESHIKNIKKNAELLKKIYCNLKFLVPEISEDGKKLLFPYIEGRSLDSKLKEKITNKSELIAMLKEYITFAYAVDEASKMPFRMTDEFKKEFGDADFAEKTQAVSVANVDMIADNLFITDNGIYCLDCEWVCKFPVPIEFLQYRSLYYFYSKYQKQLKTVISESDFWKEFEIAEDTLEKYRSMESYFQEYVHGIDSENRYTDHYRKPIESFDNLVEKSHLVEKQKERIVHLQNEEEERNKHIKKLDQHIEELGVAIRTLQEENKECQSQVIEVQSKLIRALEDNRKLIDEKQKEVDEKQKEIDKKQKEIDEYVFQLDSQKYELDKKNELIIDKNRHIQNIEAQIALDNQKINELQLPADKWNRFIMFFPIRALRYIKRNIKKLYFHTKEKKYEKLVVPSCRQPKVSIIIPVYNQFDYTYACIKSIIETIKEVPYEIIIGDDMSTDRTKRIKKYISGIRVNMNRTDHGFLMNCNRAAKLAKGDYIVFLNNDTQVKEEWLSSLVQLIESDDKIGMVGSKLVYPDGRLQEAGGIIWDDASGWNYGREQDANMPEYNYVREVDYISGASIMIHRNLWEKIGGFDPYFAPAYCEDSDLAFQVRQQGYKVMYQPKSVVVHFEGVSNGTDLNAGLKKYQVENNRKFREKWAEELKCQYPSGQDAFLARERNRGKKVILIIDHYVPTYDKDAGSKTTFQYIKMFLKKGYMVKFIGDNYAQMEPYTTILQQMGVEVLYGPWYAQHIFEWIDMNKQYIDIAYLNRPHITEKYIDYLKENTDIKLIYYGHDLHFLRTQREAEIEGNADKIVESKMWQYKEFDIMKKASVSYYPSIVEEEAIHEIDPSVKVKAITAYVFDTFKENYQYNYAKREGIMFVGGFSHGPNIDAVKWFVEEIWPEIHRCTDANFYIVGSNAPDEIKNLDGDGIVFKGFVSDEELSRLYEECRMIVVPLRYGAGVKGKVVEAIYNGLPIITTSVGAEGISGVEEVAAIADDAQEFANQVVKLYTDGETLEKMAQSTQRFIKDNFSVDAVWSIIKEDFE